MCLRLVFAFASVSASVSVVTRADGATVGSGHPTGDLELDNWKPNGRFQSTSLTTAHC